MTTADLPLDTGTVLVYADRRPELGGERFVDVRPGCGSTFDGSRHYAPVHVVGPEGRRRTCDHHDPAAVVAAATRRLRAEDVAFVRLGNRALFHEIWPAGTVVAIERRLGATVRREGATLVTWTDGDRRPTDGVDYDTVVNR